MYNLKTCVVCFSANVKLISLNSCKLRQEFQLISGIKVCIVYFRYGHHNNTNIVVKSSAGYNLTIFPFTDASRGWYAGLFMLPMHSSCEKIRKV